MMRRILVGVAMFATAAGCSTPEKDASNETTAIEVTGTVVEVTVPTTLPPASTEPGTVPPAGPGPGDVALCNDGNYSDNKDFSATCSGGGGIDRWLATFALCTDFTLARLEDEKACPGGKDGFLRLIVDDEPIGQAAASLGIGLMNELACREVTVPAPPTHYVCTSADGGFAYLVPTTTSIADVVNFLMGSSEYDEFASTFVLDPETGVVIFAPRDFDFWGVDGPNFDRFDAIDTDCLNPGTDSPELCG